MVTLLLLALLLGVTCLGRWRAPRYPRLALLADVILGLFAHLWGLTLWLLTGCSAMVVTESRYRKHYTATYRFPSLWRLR